MIKKNNNYWNCSVYSKDVEYLSMTICPHFDTAYDRVKIAQFGILGVNAYKYD
jgi:hypothetical protein